MNKPRLLIFHPTIAPYRIDFFNDLYEAFDARVCLQFWNLRDQQFDYQRIADQFEFEPAYLPEGGVVSRCQAIIRHIKEFKPDVVLTFEYGMATIVALATRGVFERRFAVVVLTDDSYDMVSGKNDFTLRHRMARNLMARKVDEIVVASPDVERWYKRRYGKGIYFPIIVDEDKAVSRYTRILPKSREYVQKYGLAGKEVLLSVSRLVNLKNLHRVIDAFGKTETDSVLVIVGDGPERDSLEEQAKKSAKRIILAGRFEGDELYAWYNLASSFVLASYRESFGAVTNEALLAGCRVVISNKAGSSCLVNDKNGETVDPMDVQGIAEAIDRQMKIAGLPDLQSARGSLMGVKFSERFDNLVENIKRVIPAR